MPQPQVSIIIPAYNSAAFIERSLGSALGQTVDDIQVIVVDDGSTDDTLRIVQDIAERDERVEVRRHEQNKGRMEARRTGVTAAKGVFTLFLDADDELDSAAAEKSLRVQNNRYDIVHFGMEMRYAGFATEHERFADEMMVRPPRGTYEGADITHAILRDHKGPWSLCAKLIRTSLLHRAFEHIPPSSITLAEDAAIFFIVSCYAQSLRGMPKYQGYVYHIDQGGSDAKWRNMDAARFAKICEYSKAMDCIEDFLEKTHLKKEHWQDYQALRAMHAQSIADRLIACVKTDEQPAAYREMLKLWPACECVAALAHMGWDKPAQVLKDVNDPLANPRPRRQVRTVGVFHHSLGVGGAEQVTANLVNLWHEMGLNVVLFTEESLRASVQKLPRRITHVQLPSPNGSDDADMAQRTLLIEQAVREHGIDVFVHHQWYSQRLPWDLLLLDTLDVATCVYCHSSFRMLFSEGHLWEFDQPRCLRYADALVVLSEADQAYLSDFNPHTYMAEDPRTVSADDVPAALLNEKNIVWVGRLTPFDKQPEDALEIFARVATVEPDATLTMVGPAPSKDEMKRLKSLSRKLGIDKRTTFTGAVNNTDSYYQQASVHLLTSRFEGWCQVLSESKCHGLPCVMYDLPNLTLARDGRGIVKVEPGQRDEAARALIELLGDRELRAALGAEARASIQERIPFDHRLLWSRLFEELGREGTPRTQTDTDTRWDMLIEACKESVRNERERSIKILLRERTAIHARNLWHRARGE